MSTTLEQFAAKCKDALKSQPGTAGRRAVCGLVKDVLKEPEFIANPEPPGKGQLRAFGQGEVRRHRRGGNSKPSVRG
jgi:hypothetical protein